MSIRRIGLLHLVPRQGKKLAHDPNGCHPPRASRHLVGSAPFPAPGTAGSLDRDALCAELERSLIGLACPVVLIDLRRNIEEGLIDLDRLMRLAPGSLVLVLDPERQEGVAGLARELGATHVISGFVPPPEVAVLVDRWITLADGKTARAGWSRPLLAATPLDLDEWLQIAGGNPVPGSA